MDSFGTPGVVLETTWLGEMNGTEVSKMEEAKGLAHVEVLEEVDDQRVGDNQRNTDEGHIASKQEAIPQSIA